MGKEDGKDGNDHDDKHVSKLCRQAYPSMPKPVLKDRALYLGDNGRCLCGKCSGVSARYSGYDISGQKVLRVTPAMAMEYRAQGDGDLACERCGFVAPAKRRN